MAKTYPDRDPEKITRRDIERHITVVQKTLKPATVFSAFHDLKSFRQQSWLFRLVVVRPATAVVCLSQKLLDGEQRVQDGHLEDDLAVLGPAFGTDKAERRYLSGLGVPLRTGDLGHSGAAICCVSLG